MSAAPWYVVLKAALCSDCASDSSEMTAELCAAHTDEPVGADEERAVLGLAVALLQWQSYRMETKGREYLDEMLIKARDIVGLQGEVDR
jgi:hypothetical protein